MGVEGLVPIWRWYVWYVWVVVCLVAGGSGVAALMY